MTEEFDSTHCLSYVHWPPKNLQLNTLAPLHSADLCPHPDMVCHFSLFLYSYLAINCPLEMFHWPKQFAETQFCLLQAQSYTLLVWAVQTWEWVQPNSLRVSHPVHIFWMSRLRGVSCLSVSLFSVCMLSWTRLRVCVCPVSFTVSMFSGSRLKVCVCVCVFHISVSFTVCMFTWSRVQVRVCSMLQTVCVQCFRVFHSLHVFMVQG